MKNANTATVAATTKSSINPFRPSSGIGQAFEMLCAGKPLASVVTFLKKQKREPERVIGGMMKGEYRGYEWATKGDGEKSLRILNVKAPKATKSEKKTAAKKVAVKKTKKQSKKTAAKVGTKKGAVAKAGKKGASKKGASKSSK